MIRWQLMHEERGQCLRIASVEGDVEIKINDYLTI